MEHQPGRGPADETLPDSPHDIRADWLTDVLRSAGVPLTSQVASISATPLGVNTGLMSQIVLLSLAYDGVEPAAPSSIIAKFPPTDAGSHGAGVSFGIFEGECGFYRELARNSAIRAPRCYFTRYDPKTGRFLTLLQDLSLARLGDMGAGCTEEEAARAVQTLARFHASWWNSPALSRPGWLRSRTGRLADTIELISEAWPTFTSRFRSFFNAEQLDVLSGARELLTGQHERISTGPLTLLHGDFKLDNLFFHPSGEITVADWGLVMSGPPMFDLATFLGINLSTAVRREHESEFVQCYVNLLAEDGVTGYRFDQAFADYKLQLLGLLPQLIAAGGLAEFGGPQAMEAYVYGVKRVLIAITDNHAVDFLSR